MVSDEITIVSDDEPSTSRHQPSSYAQTASIQMSSPAASSSTEVKESISDIDRLIQAYLSPYCSAKQITTIYQLSGENYVASASCIAKGPTVFSILDMVRFRFARMP